jgi:hypothetical protein
MVLPAAPPGRLPPFRPFGPTGGRKTSGWRGVDGFAQCHHKQADRVGAILDKVQSGSVSSSGPSSAPGPPHNAFSYDQNQPSTSVSDHSRHCRSVSTTAP